MRSTIGFALGAILVLGIWTDPTCGQARGQVVHGDEDLEGLLKERAGLLIDMPELSYVWSDSGFVGGEEAGSLFFETTKVIYYFLHWGPIETDEIDEEYVSKRVPQVWPSEELKVTSMERATVAGHPAILATVMPKRQFYRAFFLIWNCPETGRQFIADMNYNVTYKTPRSELDAEIATTSKTLACHPDAPTTAVDGHVVRYDSRRFRIRFDHPLHWYVFENPFGIAHPAYEGVRDDSIGSLLGWLQDQTVQISLSWEPLPAVDGDEQAGMAGTLGMLQTATGLVEGMDQFDKFSLDASESVTIGKRKAYKFIGEAIRSQPEEETPGFVPKAGAAVLLVDDPESNRRISAVIAVDYYQMNGALHQPVRDIFDRWARMIVSGLDP